MTQRVYKYKLPMEPGEHQLTMPRSSHILHFDADGRRELCVWVHVSLPGIDGVKRIGLAFTGEDLHFFDAVYVGTCLVDGFVWHCFDLGWKGEAVAL